MITRIKIWLVKRKLQKLFDQGITEKEFSDCLKKEGYRLIVDEKQKRVWRNFQNDAMWTITESEV